MLSNFIRHFEELSLKDVPEAGGKNASLGEMIKNLSSKGIKVPGGYIVTASAYRYFLSQTGLADFIKQALNGLNTKDLDDLKLRAEIIREKIKRAPFPALLKEAISEAHKEAERKYGHSSDFAVRSSATAEDLPGASFAGEHETYLNIRGLEGTLQAVKNCMASLFTERAISYRVDKGFDHFQVALSVGVQKMVRSDLGCSGVMFTLDTESGFPEVVVVNGAWGLGEMVVQGEVVPDEFLVFKKTLGGHNSKRFYKPIIYKKLGVKNQKMVYSDKRPTKIVSTTQKERQEFVLTDDEVLILSLWAIKIEEHYSTQAGKWTPMDIEWAKDGKSGELYIVQARPETVHSTRDYSQVEEYVRLEEGGKIVGGISVGSKVANGKAHVILDTLGIKKFQKGEILVTKMTDPDWEPIMKIASAIITDQGGRTSHAAIVSRELGIPCVVGTIEGTAKIKTGDKITVDTTGSEGLVLEGLLKYKTVKHNVKKLAPTKTKIMLNIATPETAFEKSFLPSDGVGLAREEFIIASDIGIHPLAILNFQHLPDHLKRKIEEKTSGFDDKASFYIDKLAYGIARIAAAFYPKEVILRFSDFKTNEYRTLLGGDLYEPKEENPMIGFRGASRYYHPDFAPAFALEVKAMKKVREEMGLTNLSVMIPFCRTVEEGKKVIKVMEEHGLERKSLNVYVMCEIPANVILAEEFLEVFDGMSIGSNDLAQLALGIDRDGNEKIKGISNENDPTVKELISKVIKVCKSKGKYIGICGQAPSDYPEFAKFLVEAGIDSISLNPDTAIKMRQKIYEEEQQR